jgi:hypothetical protein
MIRSEWRLFGAAHQGTHNRESGDPCQDAFEIGAEGELLWLAVADGLGSEAQSHHGARCSVDTIGTLVRGTFTSSKIPNFDMRALFERCRRKLLEEAAVRRCDPRALSTTLQVIILNGQGNQLHYGVIGDGHCITTLSTGECVVLGDARKRPIIGTAHLLHERADQYMHVETMPLDMVTGVFVFTDGLNDLFLQPRTPTNVGKRANCNDVLSVRDTVAATQDENRGVLIVNTLVNAERHTTLADDKTLAVAVRSEVKEPQVEAPKERYFQPTSVEPYRAPRTASELEPDVSERDHEVQRPVSSRSFEAKRQPLVTLNASFFELFHGASSGLAHGIGAFGRLARRFHVAAVSDWLPWVQAALLMAILGILVSERDYLRSSITFFSRAWETLRGW